MADGYQGVPYVTVWITVVTGLMRSIVILAGVSLALTTQVYILHRIAFFVSSALKSEVGLMLL